MSEELCLVVCQAHCQGAIHSHVCLRGFSEFRASFCRAEFRASTCRAEFRVTSSNPPAESRASFCQPQFTA